MAIGYTFRILDSSGTATTTAVDMDDMFVPQSAFDESGLYAWGRGDPEGLLGDNTVVGKSSPIQIGTLVNWKMVSAGFTQSSAIKRDGTLWAWGNNGAGQLGDGTTTHRSSPVQIGTLTNWKMVSSGGNGAFTSAIKVDGTLWAWGNNGSGQLGDNTIVAKLSPVQIGTSTDWKIISAGGHSGAITTNGALWSWGNNSYGKLGLNDIANRSSPVRVGTLTNWKFVSINQDNMGAITTDGTLWTWGRNSYGQLGLGDKIHRSSPVQVGTLTNWKFVSIGRNFTAAIQSNGTLWTWGYNYQGELGQNSSGSATYLSSPAQVGTLTDWKMVSASPGTTHTGAVKTDGTIWAWGTNTYGQLGQNNTTNRSSPVQVGTLTNWKQISMGGYFAIGIANFDA